MTRNLVASLAVAVLTTILQTQTIVHDVIPSAQVRLSNPATAALYQRLVATFSGQGVSQQQAQSAALRQLVSQVQKQATAVAYQDVYMLTTLMVALAIVLPILLRTRHVAAQGQGAPAGRPAVIEA